MSNKAERRFENLQKPVRSILFLDKALVWRFGVSLVISSSPAPRERMCARTYSAYDLVRVFCRACRNLCMCVWLAGSQSRLQATIFSPYTHVVLCDLCAVSRNFGDERRQQLRTGEEDLEDGERALFAEWVGVEYTVAPLT